MPALAASPARAQTLLACAALALLLACAGPRPVLAHEPEPRATVVAIHVDSTAARSVELRVDLAFENPGAPLRVTGADYQVLLEGRLFGAGSTRVEQTIAARANVQLTLPIQLAFLELPAAARERLGRGEPVELAVRGGLKLMAVGLSEPTPLRTAEFDGETEVPRWEGGVDEL